MSDRVNEPLVQIGRLGRAHGLHGEIGLAYTSFDPEELTEVGAFVWRGARGETRPLRLIGSRRVNRRLLVRFQEAATREQAANLTGGELLAQKNRLPNPGPETAYVYQLIGLRVETMDGRRLGTLESIIETGAHPIYVVRDERELLIPATPQVLRQVDLENGVIRVDLPDGLEELS